MDPPQIVIATPSQALDAWLLIGLEVVASILIFLRLQRRFTGAQAHAGVGIYVLGWLCIVCGTVLELALYLPWQRASNRWYDEQAGILLAKGCALTQLNQAYDIAQQIADQFDRVGNLLLIGGAILLVLVFGLAIYHMWRAQQLLSER
jgi:hypothetical protein